MSPGAGVRVAADPVRRRDPAGLGVLVRHDRRRRAERPARHARLDRAAARRRHRRGRRVRRRPGRRRRHARDARPDVAAAHARRLLGRALRRDDRSRPRARAARCDRRGDALRRARRLRPPLPARRAGRRPRRARGRCLPRSSGTPLLAYPVFGLVRRLVGASRARRTGAGGRAPCLTHPTASGATPRPGSCRRTRASARRTASPRGSRCGSAILGVVALAIFAVLFFRLWSLQVLSGARYLDAAQNNQLRTIRVEAPRGPILDRQGKVIVGNVPGTAVKLWVGDMPKDGPLPHDQAPGRGPRRAGGPPRARGRGPARRSAHARSR